ncbi:MAG: Nudix family hydrolase [Methylovulum sp.]|nr:Nudix family hydrolase [Methylovulum sp.]
MTKKIPLQVAVGVVKNATGQLLISLRDESLHQGGLWEFPGGKIESGETAKAALVRELKEELDIIVHAAIPLISVRHQYPDLAVQLNVFLVDDFSGAAKGREGQRCKWVEPAELAHFAFPKANQPIITAARLPSCYAILDDADASLLLVNLQNILDKGVKLIQARLKRLPPEAVSRFVGQAYPLCRQKGALLLINSAVNKPDGLAVDGIHLTSRDLLALDKRPEAVQWVAASCHNLQELLHAQAIGVDFAVLAPVLPTQTHPDANALGWGQFTRLVAEVNLPVYALGGMSSSSLLTARLAGAQGIASISAFLD